MSRTTSIRLLYRNTENTLHRYVFANREHARAWLMQPFVDPAEITLQEVAVGEERGCPTCGGRGWQQSVKALRPLTVAEFLREAP
jgi:hypothetical protein